MPPSFTKVPTRTHRLGENVRNGIAVVLSIDRNRGELNRSEAARGAKTRPCQISKVVERMAEERIIRQTGRDNLWQIIEDKGDGNTPKWVKIYQTTRLDGLTGPEWAVFLAIIHNASVANMAKRAALATWRPPTRYIAHLEAQTSLSGATIGRALTRLRRLEILSGSRTEWKTVVYSPVLFPL
jgi:hypothetical protein